MESCKLNRTVQCPTCPWKKDSRLEDIPDYVPEKHYGLEDTIAKGFNVGQPLKVMACHYSTEESNEHCIGWLYNQLGTGNNIALRIGMRSFSNLHQIKVVGEQVDSFEETLPEVKGYDPTKQKRTPCQLTTSDTRRIGKRK